MICIVPKADIRSKEFLNYEARATVSTNNNMSIHDVFISHSSATKEIARHVYYNAISNGLSVWYDEALLDLGDVLEQEIEQGIVNSHTFLLLHCAAAMQKRWVPLEMQHAENIFLSGQKIRIIVVKLDDEPLPSEFWNQFLFHEWNNDDQPKSILKLLASLTGRNPFVEIPAAAVLSTEPSSLFVNQSSTIAEHSRNYVLYYISHVKNLLSAVASVGYEGELRDTIKKVLDVSLFESLPSLHGGRFVLAPGLFEMIWPNRTRIPPNIVLHGLPDRYTWDIVKNDEVSCRISIIEKVTGRQVCPPVPLAFGITASAQL